MSLKWTSKADSDLDGIFEYYKDILGAVKAKAIVQDIIRQVKTLDDPKMVAKGRPTEVPEVRELVLQRWPFLTPYHLSTGDVEILRVHHQSRQHPSRW